MPYLVDACQAVGQLPVDVERLALRLPRRDGAQVPARPARDRLPLRLGPGAGARDGARSSSDMHGAGLLDEERFELAPDARRFENWEFPYALVLGLGAAARYALEVGIGGRQPAVDRAGSVRPGAAARPARRGVADRGARLCAIVTAEARGWDADDAGRSGCARAGVNTSAANRGRRSDLSARRGEAPAAPHLSPLLQHAGRDRPGPGRAGGAAAPGSGGGGACLSGRSVTVRRVEGAPVVAIRLWVRGRRAGGGDPRPGAASPAACSPRGRGAATGGGSPTRPRARG